ncbi:MAG: hypothetical protein M5U25_16570 [Planctomycetota bacterium]|nr:hypothetical protein [Planctomycetota bacterium]
MYRVAAIITFLCVALVVGACGQSDGTHNSAAPDVREKPFVDPVGLAELLQECAADKLSMDEVDKRIGWAPNGDSRVEPNSSRWVPQSGFGQMTGSEAFRPDGIEPHRLNGIMFWITGARDSASPVAVGLAWLKDGTIRYFEAIIPTP